MFIIFSFPFL